MKTIIIEFTQEEAKKVSHALENESRNWDATINSSHGILKELCINDKNQVDDAKNKINKALGNVPVRTP